MVSNWNDGLGLGEPMNCSQTSNADHLILIDMSFRPTPFKLRPLCSFDHSASSTIPALHACLCPEVHAILWQFEEQYRATLQASLFEFRARRDWLAVALIARFWGSALRDETSSNRIRTIFRVI
jgi:hypothetical protein